MESNSALKHFAFKVFLLLTYVTLTVQEIQLATTPDANLVLNDAMYFEIIEPVELSYTFRLRPARNFGGLFERSLTKVELRLADPIDGCGALTNNVHGTVAFVMRGGCSFLTKTLNAENANAIGTIIADSDETNDDKFVDMVDDDTNRKVNIPAMFLMGKDGAMIRHTLQELALERAVINIPINITGIPLAKVNQPPWTLW